MGADIRSRLGARIREVRELKGWRQIDLAIAAELSKGHIHEVETAQREICFDALIRVAKALGTKPSALLASIDS